MSWSDLSNAAGKGDLAKIEALLATRTATPEELREALAFAVIHDREAAITLLVQRGADPNASATMSGPALHFASSRATVDLLLSLGADPARTDSAGGDALTAHLVKNGPGSHRNSDVVIVQRFLDGGVKLTGRHLLKAVEAGNLAILELLLDRGADPHFTERNESVYSRSAASGCGPKVLALFARRGLDPNTTWNYAGSKTTLLCELCRAGELQAVQWLLDHGADPNLAGDVTPLACAEESRNQVLIDLLLDRGARPLRPALDPKLTAGIDATERAAREAAADPALRRANARALKAAGFHAAAACEVFEARRVSPQDDADALLVLPSKWRVSAAPLPAGQVVAPRVVDGRWANALATDGHRTVPLVFTYGAPCTGCDEKGELLCSMCDGSGSYSSFLDPDHDVQCDERQGCPECLATKFKVKGTVSSKGTCAHPYKRVQREAVGGNAWFSFVRCLDCSLAGLAGGVHRNGTGNTRWACATCGLFACACA